MILLRYLFKFRKIITIIAINQMYLLFVIVLIVSFCVWREVEGESLTMTVQTLTKSKMHAFLHNIIMCNINVRSIFHLLKIKIIQLKLFPN